MSPSLVRLEDVRVHFPVDHGIWGQPAGFVRAVDGISLEIAKDEILGLVGESGCGKSTLGRAILRLVEITSGRVFFDGRDLAAQGSAELRRLRRRMQMTFQDPSTALNPRMSVGETLGEALQLGGARSLARAEKTSVLLSQVGLAPSLSGRFPHELSGGQRQRVGLARALAAQPTLLVADEPTAGLDVSVQAQVVNLLSDLQEKLGFTCLLVSHDLGVIGHLADRVAVMYLGQVVELAPARALMDAPLHPYSQALLSAAFSKREERIVLEGEAASPLAPPPGCRFRPRCRHAMGRCRERSPVLRQTRESWQVACFLFEKELEATVERLD
jgi:oligopeptide transport system ATP-binding protein